MKIAWSHFAETQLDEIYDYYLKKAGEKTASNLVVSIIRQADYLQGVQMREQNIIAFLFHLQCPEHFSRKIYRPFAWCSHPFL